MASPMRFAPEVHTSVASRYNLTYWFNRLLQHPMFVKALLQLCTLVSNKVISHCAHAAVFAYASFSSRFLAAGILSNSHGWSVFLLWARQQDR